MNHTPQLLVVLVLCSGSVIYAGSQFAGAWMGRVPAD